MIRLIVVDDHDAVRASLGGFFGAHDDIDVVGEAANGHEAVELARAARPDVVLMDVRMPVMDGIEATRRIKDEQLAPHVFLVSAYEDEKLIEAGFQAGADDFALKGTLGSSLVERVRKVCA